MSQKPQINFDVEWIDTTHLGKNDEIGRKLAKVLTLAQSLEPGLHDKWLFKGRILHAARVGDEYVGYIVWGRYDGIYTSIALGMSKYAELGVGKKMFELSIKDIRSIEPGVDIFAYAEKNDAEMIALAKSLGCRSRPSSSHGAHGEPMIEFIF